MRNFSIGVRAVIAFIKLLWGIYRSKGESQSLHAVGKDLKNFFDDIGGVYVKFGQILSLRKDLLPIEVCDELRKLLDKAKPLPYKVVVDLLNQELHDSLQGVFYSINEQPIASASLGQVHKARLLSGEDVVVKVLRPGIEELVHQDVKLLKVVARLIDIFIPFLNIKIYPIVNEFGEWIWEEVDYLHEAKNLKEFSSYKTQLLPVFDIPLKNKVPQVFLEYTTKRVIVMEFIDGKTVNELISARNEGSHAVEELEKQGYNFAEIGRQFNLVTMKHVFIDGYFNADPHPANIIATPSGDIYLIDFGLVGRLNRSDRINVFRLGRAMATYDEDTAYQATLRLLDVTKVKNKQILKQAIHNLLADLRKAKKEEGMDYARASQKAMFNLFFIFNKHNIQVPPQISKALRAVVTSDGIVTSLNPGINFDEVVQDMFRVTLAATYQEIKHSINKDKLTRLFLKGVNVLEENIFLD